MLPKRKLNLKSTIQSSSTIAHFLPSSSSSSSAPPPTSPSINLTSSPPLTTSSASTNQKHGKLGKTSYILGPWDRVFCQQKVSMAVWLLLMYLYWHCNYSSANPSRQYPWN